MKTQGMSQQLEALRRMNGRDYYALFMEQGTGKTWTLLADAERQYAAGLIDTVLVFAPKGVHTNWVLREIPEHLEVPHVARAWSSGMGVRARARVDEILAVRPVGEVMPLRILAMNHDSLLTKDGFAYARKFLLATNAYGIVDESGAFKNHNAARTKALMKLRFLMKTRRIADGTPVTQAPMDVFAPMEFLENGTLGTTSYRAFVAEFAEVLPAGHWNVKAIIDRNPALAARLKANPHKAEQMMPQLIRRDEANQPVYRNLDKLSRLLAPNSFRVLKSECLDLPEKVYTQVFFDLTPKQRAAYKLLEDQLRIELADGSFDTVSALAALMKLQQVTSGFVNVNGEPMMVGESNPRIDAVMTAVRSCSGKFIVWARFREEIALIVAALKADGIETAEYHGGVGDAGRELAIDAFQKGSVRAFVSNQQAGGVGLTLTAAEDAIYCSNSYNLRHRLQSEDRCHRIGTKWTVRYTDIVATETIDEPIARALQKKMSVAAQILNDRNLAFKF